MIIGSDPFRSDIVIRDVEVEPRHAKLYRRPGSGIFALRDLDTAEGTLVNEHPIEDERLLSDGDRISLGDSILEFSDGDPVKARFYTALHRLVNHDHLTGLLTKNRFDEKFEHCLEVMSSEKKPLSVLMGDIDNLKELNDAHGHLLGEYIVGEVGRIIGELHEEEGRHATRFGGDEYQTILPGVSKEQALEIAEEVRRRIEEHVFKRDGVRVHATISIGVASFPEDGTTRDLLTRAADEALYRAKRSGGNRVCT